MPRYDNITWEHDLEEDLEVLDRGTTLLGKVKIKHTVATLIQNFVTTDGERIALHRPYVAKKVCAEGEDVLDFGETLVSYQHRDIEVVVEEVSDRTYKYSVISRVESKAYFTKEREFKGGFSKVLKALGLKEKDIKTIMTLHNIGYRSLEVHTTRDFYNHYRHMHKLGICHSCMSKTPSNYSVSLHTGAGYEINYNPLIAYEADPDWALLLLKDAERSGYQYIARAVYNVPNNSYYRIYGAEAYMQEGLAEFLIEKDDFDGQTINKLECCNEEVFVLPYVDGSTSADIEDSYLTLGGEIEACHSSGTICEGWWCGYCEETHPLDTDRNNLDGEDFCDGAEGEVFYRDTNGELLYASDACYVDSINGYTCSDNVSRCVDTDGYELCENTTYCETDDEQYSDASLLIEVDNFYYLPTDDSIYFNEETGVHELC